MNSSDQQADMVPVISKFLKNRNAISAPFASLCSSGFHNRLALDSILRYPCGSLGQSSQHRYDSFQLRFAELVRIRSNRIADTQHIVN
jgi:hypothetical protein